MCRVGYSFMGRPALVEVCFNGVRWRAARIDIGAKYQLDALCRVDRSIASDRNRGA